MILIGSNSNEVLNVKFNGMPGNQKIVREKIVNRLPEASAVYIQLVIFEHSFGIVLSNYDIQLR